MAGVGNWQIRHLKHTTSANDLSTSSLKTNYYKTYFLHASYRTRIYEFNCIAFKEQTTTTQARNVLRLEIFRNVRQSNVLPFANTRWIKYGVQL